MRIPRLDISARVLHWSHALFFIWLLITGIQIFLTSESLLGNPLVRKMHLYASLPFIILPPVIYSAGSPSARRDVKELASWGSDDLKWIIDHLKTGEASATGKFNTGQKVNLAVTLLLTAGLSLSGFIIWVKAPFSVDLVELSFLMHDLLAISAVLLLAGHILFALY